MKVKELIEGLKNVDSEAEIWVSASNKANTATYGVMYQVLNLILKTFGLVYRIPLAILMIG